jgi:hypothetical protein
MFGRPMMAKATQEAAGLALFALCRFRVIHSPRFQHFEQKAELIGSQMDANAAGFVIKL